MEPWLFVAMMLICASGSTVFAILFFREKEKSRSKLCLKSKARAEQLAIISLVATVPAVLLVLWVPFAACFLLVAPAVAWIFTLVTVVRRQPGFGTPDGSEGDYQRIAAKFPLAPITTDDQYERAYRFYQEQVDHDRLAEQCGNQYERLTRPQWRYMYELQDLLHAYSRKYPRLTQGQEWYDGIQEKIRLLESLLEQARRLKEQGLEDAGAAERQRTAEFDFLGLDWIKSIVEGPHETEDERAFHRVGFDVGEAERQLDKRIKAAQEAFRLLEAKKAGAIKYEASVRQLIKRAVHCADFLKCETLLKQAVAQGREPDADTQPIDLPRALRALGKVYQYHLDKPEEAMALYSEALRLFEQQLAAENEEITNTLIDLAFVFAKLNRHGEAEQLHLRLATMYRRRLPHGLTDTRRALERLAAFYINQGRMGEGEKLLIESLYLCDKFDHGSFLHARLDTSDALDQLIQFYAQLGRNHEAARLVDRALRIDLDRVKYKTADELRTYAQVYKAVGRDLEAEAYRFEERAARRDEELARYREEHNDDLPRNVLQHDADRRLLLAEV